MPVVGRDSGSQLEPVNSSPRVLSHCVFSRHSPSPNSPSVYVPLLLFPTLFETLLSLSTAPFEQRGPVSSMVASHTYAVMSSCLLFAYSTENRNSCPVFPKQRQSCGPVNAVIGVRTNQYFSFRPYIISCSQDTKQPQTSRI